MMRLREDPPKKGKKRAATIGAVRAPENLPSPRYVGLYGADENAGVDDGEGNEDESASELRGRFQRNAAIRPLLSDAGIDAAVVASHNMLGANMRGGGIVSSWNDDPDPVQYDPTRFLPALVQSADFRMLNIPEAMDAATTESTRRYGDAPPNVVGAFCGHGEVCPDTPTGRYWSQQMQTVADTSRGGRGVNAFVPLGRNVKMDSRDPLGKISGGGLRMFRPNAAPVDTTFTNEARYLDLIKALSAKAGRNQAR
jgi:hypothetical protein